MVLQGVEVVWNDSMSAIFMAPTTGVCCRELRGAAGCGRVWQGVAGCGSVWQCVAVCGRVWQCVAVCGRVC